MIYLYESTTKDFRYNGQPLPKAYDVVVDHLINDEFFVVGKHPLDKDGRYKTIQKDKIIKVHTPEGMQPFRILDPYKYDGYVEFEAWPLFYADMRNKLVRPFSVSSMSGQQILNIFVSRLLIDTPFTFTSNITNNHDFTVQNADEAEREPNQLFDALEVFKRIVNRWNGELVINGYDIRLVNRVGQDTDVLLYEKKNITNFVDKESLQSIVTRLHGKSGWTEDGPDGEQIERSITTTVDSPLIDAYSGVIFERQYTNNDIRTEQELKNWLNLMFTTDDIDKPSRNIELDTNIVDGTKISMGDGLNLKYIPHDVDMMIRVNRFEYDGFNNRYLKVYLGDSEEHFTGNVQNQISNLENNVRESNEAIAHTILNAAGNKIIYSTEKPSGNFKDGDTFFDTDDRLLFHWDEQIGDWVQVKSDADRQVEEILKQMELDRQQAQENYQAALDHTDKKIAEETSAWENEFNDTVADINESIGDVGARADEAITEAGANASLIDTHEAILNDISNIAIPALESNLSGLEQDISDVQSQAQSGINNALDSANTAWNHADSALSEAQKALSGVDGLEQTYTDLSVQVDDIEGELSAKVSQTDFNKLDGTVSNHETRISQNATELLSKADSSTVDTLNGIVSENSAQIGLNAESIGLKADSSRVDTVNEKVETNSANISINADEISRRLTSTEVNNLVEGKGYSTVSYVDSQINESAEGIYGSLADVRAEIPTEIGGRNLIPSFYSEKWIKSSENHAVVDEYTLRIDGNARSDIYILAEPNQIYTLSLTFSGRAWLHEVSEDGSQAWISNFRQNETAYRTLTFTTSSSVSEILFHVDSFSGQTDYPYYVKNVQLEKGTIATDWTPAPEDTDYKLQSLSNKFEVTAESIIADLNAYQETADGQFSNLNTRIETVAGQQTRQYQELTGKLNNKLENSDLNGYATESFVTTQITESAGSIEAQISSLETEVSSKLEQSDLANYATEQQLNNGLSGKADVSDLNAYATNDDLANGLSDKADLTLLTNYVEETTYNQDKSGFENRVSAIETNYVTDGTLSTELSNYVQETVYQQDKNGFISRISSVEETADDLIISYQNVRETAQLYERVIGSSENEINDSVSRIVASSGIIQTEVSSMDFGGRNLIRNSDTVYSSTSNNMYTQGYNLGMVEGKKYTYSFDIRSDIPTVLNRVFLNNGLSSIDTLLSNVPINEEWQRLSFTFTYNGKLYNGHQIYPHFYPESGTNDTTYVKNQQLERGSVATDWTPAPEDQTAYTDSAVSTVQTQLDNSWAVQTLNSNEDVMSEIAITDSTARIKGKNILLDGNVSMTNAYITDLEALSINAVEGDITRIITDHLQANTITSKHMVSSLSMIDELFGNDAYIQRLTTKNAFIESIQTTTLSADQIVAGTLDASNLNVINLNVNSLVGNTSEFIRSNWNRAAGGNVRIDGGGILSTAFDNSQVYIQNGIMGVRNPNNATIGQIGFSEWEDRPGSPWFNIFISNGTHFRIANNIGGNTYNTSFDIMSGGEEAFLRVDNGIYLRGGFTDVTNELRSRGDIRMYGNNIVNPYSISLTNGGEFLTLSDGTTRLQTVGGMLQFRIGTAQKMRIDSTRNYMNQILNMQGNNIVSVSDERLKTNIHDYNDSILNEFFEPINPVTFNWKDPDMTTETQMGLIAQRTPIISEYAEDLDEWNIVYNRQIMVNTFGIKELLNRDTDKENRIRKLEAENEGLKDRINQLEGAN